MTQALRTVLSLRFAAISLLRRPALASGLAHRATAIIQIAHSEAKRTIPVPGTHERIRTPSAQPPAVTSVITTARKATCWNGRSSVCLMMMLPSTPN